MFFVALALRLQLLDGALSAGIQAGIYAHAAVMQVISAQDEELGRVFHDMGRHKRFTVAVIESKGKEVLLRLTFMSERGLDAAHAAMNRFSQDPLIRLGQSHYRVTDVYLSGSPWTGVSTWADFVAPPSCSRLEFTFVTPTAFTKDDGNGRRFCSLYPEPGDLFRGLAHRWTDLAGPALPASLDDYLRRGGCVIAAHRLHTETVRLKVRTQVGFRGTTTYECLNTDTAHVAALNQLTRFAFFAGVGYQTARGMGAVTTRVPAQR